MLRLEFTCNGKYYPDIDALSASEEAQKHFGNMITELRHFVQEFGGAEAKLKLSLDTHKARNNFSYFIGVTWYGTPDTAIKQRFTETLRLGRIREIFIELWQDGQPYNPKKNRVCPPGEIFGLDKSYREKLASLKRELIRTDAKLRLHVTTDPTRPEGYRHQIEFPECRPELAEKISALLD